MLVMYKKYFWQYRELYKANLRTIAQERGQKALKKEFTLTSGEIIMELEMLKNKGVKKLYNGHLGGDTDIDKLIDICDYFNCTFDNVVEIIPKDERGE